MVLDLSLSSEGCQDLADNHTGVKRHATPQTSAGSYSRHRVASHINRAAAVGLSQLRATSTQPHRSPSNGSLEPAMPQNRQAGRHPPAGCSTEPSRATLPAPGPSSTRAAMQTPMSWVSGFLVARTDNHKTAWGERNGRESRCSRGSSSWGPRYMSCLREPDVPDATPPPTRRTVGSDFGTRDIWQEDHYCKKGGTDGKATELLSKDGPSGMANVGDDAVEGGEAGQGAVRAVLLCVQRLACVFQSKRFESTKLERLYQRYFFRLNQSSLTTLLGLLALVCGIMLAFHCLHGHPDVAYVSVLSVAMALFLVLMVVCNRQEFRQDYLWVVSYLVMALLVAVQVLSMLNVAPRSASEGVWWSVFFIHTIYTLLPVRMRGAMLGGATLSAIHIVAAWRLNLEDNFVWRQVRHSVFE
ncbi:hypothetical protein P4O66_022536 [Electrophorus voltai]|uniref:Adenylate cyclase N-terminal domain-containing protein n=1 Tax=Electrophorus voltai TaxID=2609070 RepID=A0AAD9E4E8_9TELE|nr:hypothetical protein P4O66_022536 [Electrophorus voltai]